MEIKEIFYSIQGEGYNFGKPVIFVRFACCNLDCHWCDERLSRKNNADNMRYQVSAEEVYSQLRQLIEDSNCHSIIFTGGEPSIYYHDIVDIIAFCDSHYQNMWYGCESNGTGSEAFYDLLDYICISPKYKQTDLDNFILAHKSLLRESEMRIVIDQYNDEFKSWVDQMLSIGEKTVSRLYLSPVTVFHGKDMLDWTDTQWSFNIKDTMKMYDELKKKHDIRISLQAHKLVGVR